MREKVKEKDTGKIVLSIVLVILMIIILFIAGYYIYNFAKDYGLFENKPSSKVSDNNDTIKTLSDVDALKEIKEKYQKANDIYLFTGLNVSENLLIIDEKQAYEITNYNEIMDNVFTANGKKQFEDYYKDVIIKVEGKVYKQGDIKDENAMYDSTEFIKKSIDTTKINYTAKSKFIDKANENKEEYKENDFVIVKQNDKWLIDNFTFVK